MIHYVDSPVIKPKIISDKKESKSEIESKEKLKRVEKLEKLEIKYDDRSK